MTIQPLRIIPSLSYNVDPRCDMRCEYCPPYFENYQTTDGLTLSDHEARLIVTGAARAGIGLLRLSGGEPMLRPEHVIGLVRTANLLSEKVAVRLNTNGARIQRWARQLKSSGLDVVKVSLDTTDSELFASITRSRSFDRVVQGIRACVDAGLAVEINMVYSVCTSSGVWDLIRFCRDEGVSVLKILDLVEYDDPTYFANNYIPMLGLHEDLARESAGSTVERLSSSRGVPMRQYMVEGFRVLVKDCLEGTTYSKSFCSGCELFPCQEGFYNLTLNSDGTLKPCRLVTDRRLNLRTVLAGTTSDDESINSVRRIIEDLIDSTYSDITFEARWRPPTPAAILDRTPRRVPVR